MVIDNVILVGIVISLILCFYITMYVEKYGDIDLEGPSLIIIFTLLIWTAFWGAGYLIFWVLKLIFD